MPGERVDGDESSRGFESRPLRHHYMKPHDSISSAKLTAYRPSKGTMEGYYHEGAYAVSTALEGKVAGS